MGRALTITLSSRMVVAARFPFMRRPEVYRDLATALDEIRAWPWMGEPLIVRATTVGGTKAAQARVAGDWLLDRHDRAPCRLPPARDFWTWNATAQAWAERKRWLDAWETCRDGAWMLDAAVKAGIARADMVRATIACARTVLDRVPSGDDWPRHALDVAADVHQDNATVRDAARRAMFAASGAMQLRRGREEMQDGSDETAAVIDYYWRYETAALAAYHASSRDVREYRYAAALTSAAEARDDPARAARDFARAVRATLPTLTVLRSLVASGRCGSS